MDSKDMLNDWFIDAIKANLVLEHGMLLKDASILVSDEFELNRIIKENDEIINSYSPKTIALGLVLLKDALKQPIKSVQVNKEELESKGRRTIKEILGNWKAPDDYELLDF